MISIGPLTVRICLCANKSRVDTRGEEGNGKEPEELGVRTDLYLYHSEATDLVRHSR